MRVALKFARISVSLLSLLLLIPSIGLADKVTGDQRVNQPVTQPVIHPTKSARPKSSNDARKRHIVRTLKQLLELKDAVVAPYTEKDISELNAEYQKMTADPEFEGITSLPGPYEDTARECGVTKQKENSPDNFGGRTMCGRAIRQMVACMSHAIGGASDCFGRCGESGKDYIRCPTDELIKCGYESIDPHDLRCKMPGAVLAYQTSPTARGKRHGHVEFVCGKGQYCSVYREPKTEPWPKNVADACWYPRAGTVK